MKLTETINSIEAELSQEHEPGFHHWMEQKYPGEIDKTIDAFSKAIDAARNNSDPRIMYNAADTYKEHMVSWMREYKKEKNINECDDFLKSLNMLTNANSRNIKTNLT